MRYWCCRFQYSGEKDLPANATRMFTGAAFFASADSRLLIKALKRREALLLLQMLPEYLEHIAATPHTLLPRFYVLPAPVSHPGPVEHPGVTAL